MTQENKELLLKDLCARLPYNVICQVEFKEDGKYNSKDMLLSGIFTDEAYFTTKGGSVYSNEYKPYLFPLSSMTEEQLYEIKEITEFKYNHNTLELVKWTETHTTLEFWLEEVPQYSVIEVFDWLNKNHFDYRCLIEKGLAIDATGLNIY